MPVHGPWQAGSNVSASWRRQFLALSSSVLGQRCRDLLVQLYLQRPELRVPVHEVLLHSAGATGSSVCKVRGRWPGQRQ